MPITNLWDSTFPPDTQLANLLGSDLRNFRLDTQQRMAAISGTLANRWNPGADIQPTNWTGLLYFTTDTNQIFQWSGAAWVDITTLIGGAGRFFFVGNNIVPVTVASTTVITPLQAITVAANTIGVGQCFYVDCAGVMSVGPTSGQGLIINLFMDSVQIDGGNPITVSLGAANNQLWGLRLFFTCLTNGATGTLHRPNMIFSYLGNNFNNNAAIGAGFTIDTTVSHQLQLKVTWTNNTNSITQNTMSCFRVG